jgi:hypothetical protein
MVFPYATYLVSDPLRTQACCTATFVNFKMSSSQIDVLFYSTAACGCCCMTQSQAEYFPDASKVSLHKTIKVNLLYYELLRILSLYTHTQGKGLCDGLISRPEESYRVSKCMCNHRNPERGPMFQLGT